MKHSLIRAAHNIFTIIEEEPEKVREHRAFFVDELLRIGRELTLCEDVNQSLFDSIRAAILELHGLS